MPPPPQHEDVKRPQEEPPQSWSIALMMGVITDLDSAEQHPAAREVLLAQALDSRVKGNGAQRSTARRASQARQGHLPGARRAPHPSMLRGWPRGVKSGGRNQFWQMLLPIPSEEISRVSTGLRVYSGQVMPSCTRLPPRHRQVTPTQEGTRLSTHLLRLVRSDQMTRVTSPTPTGEPTT